MADTVQGATPQAEAIEAPTAPTPAPEATTTPTIYTFDLALGVVVAPDRLTTGDDLYSKDVRNLEKGFRLVQETPAFQVKYQDMLLAAGDGDTASTLIMDLMDDAGVWNETELHHPLNGLEEGLGSFLITQLPAMIDNGFASFDDLDGGVAQEVCGAVLIAALARLTLLFADTVRQLRAGDLLRCTVTCTATEPRAAAEGENESGWSNRCEYTCQLARVYHVQTGTSWTPDGGILSESEEIAG